MSGLFDPPDRGLFLRSEKDTRPFWETDQRGMFWPIMRSGYNNARSWAVPEALGGHGISVMHDIVQGKPLTVDEINHGAQGASNFMLVGGLAGNVGSKPQPGVAAMFAGPRAKTADHAALAKAQAAEAAGTPREQIWKETGWFKGVDGKWRHEIDDSQMSTMLDNASGRASDVLSHDSLFAAYPQLARTHTDLKMKPDVSVGGSYSAGGITAQAADADPLRATVLHELQHGTQAAEGFARGGNPAEFEKSYKVPFTKDLYFTPNVDRAFDKYRKLAGEVEARTVESRRNLSDIERRARPPWLDYDVPEAQQIVRFGNEGPQMSMSGAQPPKAAPSRAVDPLGYYSQLDEVLKQFKPTDTVTAQTLMQRGVKQAELDARGLGNAFDNGGVRVGELKPGEAVRLNEVVRDEFDYQAPNATKWHNYSLDANNPSYRETVLHLPPNMDMTAGRKAFEKQYPNKRWEDLKPDDQEYFARRETIGTAKDDFQSGHFPEPNIVGHMMTSLNKHEGKNVYTLDQIQSDWGQKLRDGGVRDEAKAARLMSEMKSRFSDLDEAAYVPSHPESNLAKALAQRRALPPDRMAELSRLAAEWNGAQNGASGHPLVNTTDQWVNTTLRRGFQQAIENNADYMAVPSGKTVLSYNPGDTHGMSEFYDKIVPKNLQNILAKLDKAGAGRQFVQQLETPSGPKGDGFSLFPITPAMREAARNGLPLFSNPATAAVAPLLFDAERRGLFD